MKSFSLRLALAAALVSLSNTGFALSLPVSMDTFTTTKGAVATVTTANGKATTLAVSPTQDALVLFDLGGLPAGFTAANLVGARLRFYVAKVTKPGDLAIHAALDRWNEDANTLAPGTAANPVATVLAAKVAGKRFIVVDVTATVKDWLATPANNHGLAIIAAGATPTLKATLGAKEGPGIGQPAELEIEVNAAGGVYQNGDPTTDKIDGMKIASGTVGNTQLVNPAVTVNAGTGLSGGGVVALGGAVTLNNAGVTSLAGGGGVLVSGASGAVTLGSNATTNSTPDTLVKRGSDGSFSAGAITATVFAGDGSALTSIGAGNVTGQILNGQIASGLDAAKFGSGSVSNSELGYLDGVTSPIQTQFGTINSSVTLLTAGLADKVSKAGDTMTGALTVNGNLALGGALRVPGAGVGTNGAAFIYVTAAGNVASVINHPLCNGDPNAILIITHHSSGDINTPSNLHNHPVGVSYSGSNWYIYNEDFAFMPAGVSFNVLIIKP